MNNRRSNVSFSGRAFAVLLAVLLSIAASAQTLKQDRTAFSATITSFHTYLNASTRSVHYMAATIHLQNKTKKPLILGYSGKGFGASDEQGNRYAMTWVRGIGEVSGAQVDPKFVLAPEAGGDMLVELSWRGSKTDIFGVTFDLHMALRELKRLEGAQYQVGAETTLEFTGLKTGYAATLENATDPAAHLVNAGPFKAQITRSKFGKSGRWTTVVDLTMKIENTSSRPIILAYEQNSIFGNDDLGNVYARGSASSTSVTVSGIGLTGAGSADPQFVLAPGESKEVHFTIGKAERVVLGTDFACYLALEELEILPSKQIREVRQYSLTFPGISEK